MTTMGGWLALTAREETTIKRWGGSLKGELVSPDKGPARKISRKRDAADRQVKG
jgi:hypothetical protein